MAQTAQRGRRRAADDSPPSSPPPAAKKRTATARKSTGGRPPADRTSNANASAGRRASGGGAGQDGAPTRSTSRFLVLLRALAGRMLTHTPYTIHPRRCVALCVAAACREAVPAWDGRSARDPQVPEEHGPAHPQAAVFTRGASSVSLCGLSVHPPPLAWRSPTAAVLLYCRRRRGGCITVKTLCESAH